MDKKRKGTKTVIKKFSSFEKQNTVSDLDLTSSSSISSSIARMRPTMPSDISQYPVRTTVWESMRCTSVTVHRLWGRGLTCLGKSCTATPSVHRHVRYMQVLPKVHIQPLLAPPTHSPLTTDQPAETKNYAHTYSTVIRVGFEHIVEEADNTHALAQACHMLTKTCPVGAVEGMRRQLVINLLVAHARVGIRAIVGSRYVLCYFGSFLFQ